MDSNRSNVSHGFHIPDFSEKFFFGKYSVRILCKECEQIILLGCKGCLFSVYPYTTCSLVDLDSSDLYNIILLHVGTDQTIVSVHMCLNSGYQFTRAERLCHVIICSKSQTSDLVDVIFLCRHHDDRNVFLLAHLSADIETVHFRKHQIQNDQIKFLVQCTCQSCISSVAYLNLKPGEFQIVLLQICDCFFIFYD